MASFGGASMSIKIVGSPDKDFTPYVHRAAKFFADKLLTKQMQDNTNIIVKFNKKMTECGSAGVEGYNARNQPRDFLIEINPYLGARGILETLAHEMVHVKQFAYGHTNETLSKWLDTHIDTEKVDYWFQPWEIEAHGLETGLLTLFAIEEQLWMIFKDFREPGTIKKSKINWKKQIL
jgi:hypothetical protein